MFFYTTYDHNLSDKKELDAYRYRLIITLNNHPMVTQNNHGK